MQKAYLNLLKFIISEGHTISINDGGDTQEDIHRCTYTQAKEAIEAVEEAWVYVRSADGKSHLGTAYVMFDYDQEPDETIADYTVTPFMEKWDRAYREQICRNAPDD